LNLFRNRAEREPLGDFAYLSADAHYFDSACQTLRPQPVISAVTEYYQRYNACGGRVKYAWGDRVDGIVAGVRKQLLKLVDKNPRDYTVAFCLNTTAGINLVLQQLPEGRYKRIVTSDIEHNSVFLPTQSCAKRLKLGRLVLSRCPGGALNFKADDLDKAVVVVNTTSNIDGRRLANAKELTDAVHRQGGAIVLDAAQTMGHDPRALRDVDFDALCGSGHKMYGPSLGFIIIRKTFLNSLDCFLIGGGTVSDVRRDDFDLLDSSDEAFARLEPGLQDFAGIAGLGAAISWREHVHEDPEIGRMLYESLAANQRLKMINFEPGPIISFYSEKVDAHRLALYLSAQNIMVRSGYFCCHYYLKNVKQLPPLLRISIGLQNSATETMQAAGIIHQIVNNL
jgi:selenocysteine lyase/cysteine desulfurase